MKETLNVKALSSFFLKNRNPVDIHFYFTEETAKSALEIRQRMSEELNFLTFYDPANKPIGPHLLPMWEADFSKSRDFYNDFGIALVWLMANRGNHSVLVHPHTGDELNDHTTHALWLGEKLDLKLSIFK